MRTVFLVKGDQKELVLLSELTSEQRKVCYEYYEQELRKIEAQNPNLNGKKLYDSLAVAKNFKNILIEIEKLEKLNKQVV